MRKIIAICITLLLFSSCSYLSGYITIIGIQDYTQDNVCVYETNQSVGFGHIKFVDDCNKFQIGDTIKLTK